jgi:hypothetical protein
MARNDEQVVLIPGCVGTTDPMVDGPVSTDGFDLNNLEEVSPRSVPIGSLTPGTYLRRSGTNAGHVQLLLGAANSSELPPILVQEHGWRVIDGLHRLEAAKLRGDQTIAARFLDCTDEEALVLAIKSNITHGLPLSKADRVEGAKRVLAAHPDWSDRAIAGITGLSAKTIASLRNRSADGPRFGGKRLGRDGRRRPVTAGEGRKRAAEYISAHPEASLRQVARETDVSLGTVHDVSARIRRGVDPERNGHRMQPGRIVARPGADVVGSITDASAARFSPPANGTPLARRKRADAPRTWSAISNKVANDPAIRYTEGGKEFLRWMAMRTAQPDEWREFIDAIPVHWLGVLAPIADGLSEEWGAFAEQLRSRQEAVS